MRFDDEELDALRITKEDNPELDQAGLWLVSTPVDVLNSLIAQAREANALRAEVERWSVVRDEIGGSRYVRCRPGCDLALVRPGKVQCSCEEGSADD